jgi:hypothetical protein
VKEIIADLKMLSHLGDVLQRVVSMTDPALAVNDMPAD